MELHFQQQQQNAVTKGSKFKGRNRSSSNTNRFVGVRQRPSGRWVAEIKGTTQKIRMWLGTFNEAACLLRGSNTRTNFITHVPSNSPLASRIRNLLDRKMAVKQKHLPTCNTSAGANTSGCTLSNDMNVETQVPDDDYKSSICNFNEGFELVSSRSDPSWVLEPGFECYPFEHDRDHPFLPENIGSEIEELKDIKVERGASASLHAISGVYEYLETVHDPVDALWDLPPFCKSF